MNACVTNEKPYNRCLSCRHLKNRCDGPRTSAMKFKRWCEFMRDMKELHGLTIDQIARASDVSDKTIARLMKVATMTAEDFAKADIPDLLRDTARRIENAIIGSSNKYPCYLDSEEETTQSELRLNEALRDLERAVTDNQDYRSALEGIHTSYNAEMQAIRDDARRKIDYLLSELNRVRQNNDRLCKELDNLWDENQRKSKMIDAFMQKL